MKEPRRKSSSKNFLFYGLAIFLLLFFVNIATAYIMHFYVIGASCMSKEQIAQDQRCLYILGNQVYEHGTRQSPHQGHPCGTDVTAIIPASHIENPALHLLPNYIANLCLAATPTPTSKPTNTPTPTMTPMPTAAPTTAPTVTPISTATPTPKPTLIVMLTATSIPTQPSIRANTSTPTTQPAISISATPTITLKSADITGDGVVDLADYNALLRCYHLKVKDTSPTCATPAMADLNQDGIVDAVDYNIFLYEFSVYRREHPISTATISPTMTASPTNIPTVTAAPTPTKHMLSPTLIANTPTLIMHVTPMPQKIKKTSPIITLIAGIANKAALLTQIFDWIIFLIFLLTLGVGIMRSKFLREMLMRQKSTQNRTFQSQNAIEGMYYCKPQKEQGAVLLVDGDRQIQGYYKKGTATEGFVKIKGIQREENGKKFIEIIELLPTS